MTDARTPRTITNFGGNHQFTPHALFTSRSEAELLEILRANRGQRIRAIGRLHSWSPALVGEEVVIDTHLLNRVSVHDDGVAPFADIEAGCQIKHALTELARQGGFTLPTLGLITEQSIAGAAATGTHGSGRHCLSHYVQSVRLACYDPQTGEPVIRVIDGGAELRAAQCGLGCLGIITSVRLPIRKQYQIEEHLVRYNTLTEVLDQEAEYPLQQFFLVPWRWDYYAQHRRETDRSRSMLAWLYRFYWSLGMDVAFHALIYLLIRGLPGFCTRQFYRWIMPCLIPQGWRVVDRSDRQLTMEHELFRHIEIELFVQRSQLPAAAEYVTWLLRHLGGERVAPTESVRTALQQHGQWQQLESLHGTYLHHYPVCVRKVLADETLISMSSGDAEPWYALSFISYAHPSRRDSFYRFADVLARTMASLFNARPHWGKYCPLPPAELRRLYPHLDQFAEMCRSTGSLAVFANDWLRGILTPCETTKINGSASDIGSPPL